MAEPNTILHLRAEDKPLEHRSCLTPTTAKALLDAGYEVLVERSPPPSSARDRIFQDEEFEAVGCKLIEEGSWKTAPKSHVIVGLKELPEDDFPLEHEHISFFHCYKQQRGWEKVLSRLAGHGLLYDLEFLQDESGRRVAAFGYHAGFAGAALALKAWLWQLREKEPLPGVEHFTDGRGYYRNDEELKEQIRADIAEGMKLNGGRRPKMLIIGALGRCGRGAVDLCEAVGCDTVKWDLPETSAKPGPYQEIVEADCFLNAIYLMTKIPPFVDMEILKSPGRKLSVICDVSCDPNSENNPIPVYTDYTSFSNPTAPVKIEGGNGTPLSVISIDHLPSLLPREASEAFSNALLPSLLQLKDRKTARVWQEAEKLFHEKVATLPAEYRK